jgi:hypothetical protein
MQHLESSSLPAYQRALARLHELEEDFLQHLTKIHELTNGDGEPTLRQLAFLEGLRRERDDARLAAHRAENEVINRISSALGIPPDNGT